jgi:hypothetical protein
MVPSPFCDDASGTHVGRRDVSLKRLQGIPPDKTFHRTRRSTGQDVPPDKTFHRTRRSTGTSLRMPHPDIKILYIHFAGNQLGQQQVARAAQVSILLCE